jgi:glycerol-3-phosphate dehydrogenase (NAD(P)+)
MDPLAKEGSDDFKKNISVIGAGSFGTALAEIASRAGNNVKIYARNREVVDGINQRHRNPHYLSEFDLSPNIVAVDNVEDALSDIDFVILAIPTQLV